MFTSSFARRLIAAGAGTALAVGVAGCSSDPVGEPHGAVSFVIGARSNMPAPRLDGLALAPLRAAVEDQSYVSIVVADGVPEVTGEKELLIEGANDVARDQSRRENERGVEEGILTATADDEESDMLAALELAARTIRSRETSPRTIVVVDSGLSTVAPLDFTQPGMLDAEPQEVVSYLQQKEALPDLSGLAVVWQGLGDTAAPQEPLTIGQRRNLEAIWTAILAAAGDPDPEFEDAPLIDEGPEGLPDVTPVPIPQGPECTPGRIVLTSADVAFQPDSADFRDPSQARSVLQSVAEQLIAAGATATLTGTTADVGDKPGQIELSRARAQTVADELVDLGVPSNVLSVDGVGSDFPGHVPDHAPDGSLDPAAAAENRKVIVESIGAVSLCEEPARP